MDAIADPTFQQTKARSIHTEELPSLLTVVLDTSPRSWTKFDEETGKKDNILHVLQALMCF